MPEVKVLYATPTADPLVWTQPYDIQVVRSFGGIQALPGTGVLGISIFRESPRLLVSRMYPDAQKLYQVDDEDVLYGTDIYALFRYRMGTRDMLFWDQWDEREEQFYGLDLNDEDAGRLRFDRPDSRIPAGAIVKLFGGAYVHPRDWAAARVVIDSNLRV